MFVLSCRKHLPLTFACLQVHAKWTSTSWKMTAKIVRSYGTCRLPLQLRGSHSHAMLVSRPACAQAALQNENPFAKAVLLDDDLHEAIAWIAARTADEVKCNPGSKLALLLIICRWLKQGRS